MNTHPEYRRYRPARPTEPSARPNGPATDWAPPPLDSDQSIPVRPTDIASRTGKRIAWIRPTELASFASPAITRGINLQTELSRRLRRSPTALRRAMHRTPTPAPAPVSSASSGRMVEQEGLPL